MANSQSGKGKVNDELGAFNKMTKKGKSSKKDEDMSKKNRDQFKGDITGQIRAICISK